MKLLRIPKLPKFKLPRRRQEPPKRLEARLRASSAATADSYDDEEPQTKLTGALIIVAILHFVAVGGIYAFNQIKSSRRVIDVAPATTPAKTAAKQPAVADAPKPPVEAEKANGQSAPAPAVAPIAPVLKQRVYNVKPGDTLIGIAKNFNVAVNDLKAANGMSNDTIRAGQVLNLPGAKPTAETAPVPAPVPAKTTTKTELSTKNYTVKSGDRLIFIAKKFGVTQEDLVALNKIKDPGKLQVGQTLKVPVKK